MKKVLISIGIVILIGITVVMGVYNIRGENSLDERVVYIRSIDRTGLQYVATIDDVASTLEAVSPTEDPNTRVFESLDQVPVSLFSIASLSSGKRLPIFRLAKFLKSNPAYTNVVFTVELKNGVITNMVEEKLD